MTAPHDVPDPGYEHRPMMFWLPPNGIDNRIPASAWAILADLDHLSGLHVLSALADADIGGYLAPTRTHPDPDTAPWRLWVDTHRYSRAEELLRHWLTTHRNEQP